MPKRLLPLTGIKSCNWLAKMQRMIDFSCIQKVSIPLKSSPAVFRLLGIVRLPMSYAL